MNQELGIKYERYIGKKFEVQNHFVIYNGLINGLQDNGVDIIVVSSKKNVINLIQCKNWNQKRLYLSDIENIYNKMFDFRLNCMSFNATEILEHLAIKKNIYEIEAMLKYVKEYYNIFEIKYKLYITNDKVIDLEIGKHLKLIRNNKFLYKKMEIICRGII